MDALTEFFTGLRQDVQFIKKEIAEIRKVQQENVGSPRSCPRYRRIEWLCEVTGWAKQTAYQNVNEGKVKGVHKVGKNLLFDEDAVLGWIAENRINSVDAVIQSINKSFSDQHTKSLRKRRAVEE